MSDAEETAAPASASKATAASPSPSPSEAPAKLTLFEKVRIFRDIFTIAAFAIAGIWALTTFWYHSWYQPRHEQPSVSTSLTFNVLGEKDGKLAVNAHLVMRNTSNVPRATWGATFHAFVRRVTFAQGDAGFLQIAPGATGAEGFRDAHESGNDLIASSVDMVTRKGRHLTILAHGEHSWDFFFYVDRSSGDEVVVTYDILHPDRDEDPESEWFKIEQKPNEPAEIVPTEVCLSAPECRSHYHTNSMGRFSLWK